MNKYEGLSKEQLIFLLQRYKYGMFVIREIYANASNKKISSEDALEEIRDYIFDVPDMSTTEKLSNWVDYMRGKISSKEYYRTILGEEKVNNIEIGKKELLLNILNKEIYDFCHDCPAWSGSDCTLNPYTDRCLKDKLCEN